MTPQLPPGAPQFPPFFFEWQNFGKKKSYFTKNAPVKSIFGLGKRNWCQIVQKSILFSYHGTRNRLGKGKKSSKFEILGHFPKIPSSGEGKILRFFRFLEFCHYCLNHLIIPWNICKKGKNHEIDPCRCLRGAHIYIYIYKVLRVVEKRLYLV